MRLILTFVSRFLCLPLHQFLRVFLSFRLISHASLYSRLCLQLFQSGLSFKRMRCWLFLHRWRANRNCVVCCMFTFFKVTSAPRFTVRLLASHSPLGSFCASTGLTGAPICSSGSFCTNVQTVVSCPSRLYCPAGSTSAAQANCSSGFYCSVGSRNRFGFNGTSSGTCTLRMSLCAEYCHH